MNKAKTMFNSSVVYFIGRGLSGIVSMLMLPIYTKKISPEQYGYYETINSIVVFLIPVLCIEVWTGMLKYVLNLQSSKCDYTQKDAYSVSFAILNLGCVFFVVGCAILYLISPFNCFWLVLLSGISLAYSCIEGYVARSESKNVTYAASGIIGTLVNALSGILCVYVFGLQAEALFIAYIAGNIAQIIWLEINNKIFLKKRINFFKIDTSLMKPMVIFCIPLGINSIVYYLMNNFNKVVISVALGDGNVGIFTVAGKFMAIATSIAAVIQYAWVELTFSLGEDDDKSKTYNTAMNIVTNLSLFLVLGMLPVIHLLFPYLIESSYGASFDLIPIYYFSLGFTIISGFLTNILRAENDTRTGLYARLVACAFSLVSLVVLIPMIGLQGVGISISLGAISEYIFLSIVLRKHKIRFYPVRILIFTVSYVAISVAFYSETILYSVLCLVITGIVFVLLNGKMLLGMAKHILKK